MKVTSYAQAVRIAMGTFPDHFDPDLGWVVVDGTEDATDYQIGREQHMPGQEDPDIYVGGSEIFVNKADGTARSEVIVDILDKALAMTPVALTA
jgi:hypothetical protein